MNNTLLQKNISDTIANLSFPLTIWVVAEHCFITGSGNSIINTLFSILGIPSISSAFFVISGYLFFRNVGRFDLNTYRNKVSNRFRTLLIPYFIANTFMIICYGLMHYFTPNLINPDNFNVLKFSFKQFLLAYWNAGGGFPICYPLWYIRNLYIIVLLSPLLYILLKQKYVKYISILVIAFAYHFFSFAFLTSVFYFYFGALLSQKETEEVIIKHYNRFPIVTAMVLILFLTVSIIDMPIITSKLLESIQRFSGVILTIILGFFLSKKYGRTDNKLFKSSFFLYLFHAFPIFILRELVLLIIRPTSTIMYIFSYILIVLLTLAFVISGYFILKRYFPKLTAIITGGRDSKK